jgi:thiol-disulfide isomerase/thioredoxin
VLMSPKPKNTMLQRQGHSKTKPAGAQSRWFLPVLVIAVIAVFVGVILLLKTQRPPAAALSAAQSSAPAAATGGQTAVTSDPAAVNGPFKPSSPADQLNQALAQGKPALVFMHSTTCQSCIDMMKVVDQVSPEFAGQIALVDVDVYDDANGPLMQMLGLRYIPTVVAFNTEGKASQNVGVMKPDAFRTFLRQSALGN